MVKKLENFIRDLVRAWGLIVFQFAKCCLKLLSTEGGVVGEQWVDLVLVRVGGQRAGSLDPLLVLEVASESLMCLAPWDRLVTYNTVVFPSLETVLLRPNSFPHCWVLGPWVPKKRLVYPVNSIFARHAFRFVSKVFGVVVLLRLCGSCLRKSLQRLACDPWFAAL